jgi:hypothetical protein
MPLQPKADQIQLHHWKITDCRSNFHGYTDTFNRHANVSSAVVIFSAYEAKKYASVCNGLSSFAWKQTLFLHLLQLRLEDFLALTNVSI